MPHALVSLLGLFAFVLGSLVTSFTTVVAQEGFTPHVLRIYWGDSPPDTLDPHHSDRGQWDIAGGADFEGLTKLDEGLTPIPGAAESWEFSPDGKTLTFHLRDGLVYSDGVPVIAEHFVYAARRLCSPELNSRSAFEFFDVVGCEELFTSRDTLMGTPVGTETETFDFGVRALDDRTLEYRFEKPAPYFPVLAARWRAIPLREDLIEAGGPDWWANPATRIGNGPFKLVAYETAEPDQRLVFERNDRYWGGPARLDRLEVLFADIEDPATLEAYRHGEYDMIWPGEAMFQEIEADPELSQELVTIPIAGTIFYPFNFTREPFTDPKVREAFAYAFDRDAYCQELSFGICTPNLGWVSPGVPGYIETAAFAFDPAKAREALAASSYGGPENLPEIDWYIAEGEEGMAQDAAWLVAQYREVLDVHLNVVALSWEEIDALYDDLATTPQFDSSTWFAGPEIQGWFSVWRCGSELNSYGYCNPRYDALVDRANAELEPAKRLALYEAAHRVLLADAPAVFVLRASQRVLVKPYVIGYSRTTPNEFWPGFTELLTVDVVPSG